MNFEEADFYTCDEDEEALHQTDPDEAIEEYLGYFYGDLSEAPETIEVYAWGRVAIDRLLIDTLIYIALESVLERIDEEYGDEDSTIPTESMMAAAKSFAEAVLDEYEVWRCGPCGQRTVAVLPWVRKHRPDWLEGKEGE